MTYRETPFDETVAASKVALVSGEKIEN